MKTNTGVWSAYQPGYVHPEYVPYLRKKTFDKWGNEVQINTWEKQGDPTFVEPALVRVNKGLTFQLQFSNDPCPNGFSKADNSYCVRQPLKHEQVFYTDKAFLPKRQYWGGYADDEAISNTSDGKRQTSNTFDLRSVNPFTGNYTVYYPGHTSAAPVRYGKPVINTRKQYDQSWDLPAKRGYATLHTNDSYLA